MTDLANLKSDAVNLDIDKLKINQFNQFKQFKK